MRLIDADEFEVITVDNLDNTDTLEAFMNGMEYILNKIDEAEEVKAIPIEWIRNVWLKQYQGVIEPYPLLPLSTTFEDVMDWLIEDWRNENETN